MWNLSKEVKEKFSKCHLLPIHESDHQWEIELREAHEEGEDLLTRLNKELEEVKEELLRVLPSRFVRYVEKWNIKSTDITKSRARRLFTMD